MIAQVVLAQPWHCGAMVRKLREEQLAVALSFRRNVHRDLTYCFNNSGILRSWISEDRSILAIIGVIGPMLALEGEIWLALSEEGARHPLQVVRESRKILRYVMTLKHRIYAAPFEADLASVRFAEALGFVRMEMDEHSAEYGKIPMVLAGANEAYRNARPDLARVN